MRRINKHWFAAVGIVLVVVTAVIIVRRRATGFDRRMASAAPFGIFFALDDDTNADALDVAAQLIVFPEQKKALFLFLNTDACYEGSEKAVRNVSFGEDRFSRFTGISSSYSIRISRTNAARFLNMLGGAAFFMEDNATFQESAYQYPRGLNWFSGEQMLEYAVGRETLAPHERYLSGLDRVYRTESTIMNLLWRKNRMKDQVAHARIHTFLYSLAKSDLSLPELKALLAFLTPDDGVQINVLEVPLEGIPPGPGAPEGRLVVKEKRARSLFNEYRDNMSSGRLRPDAFPLEVLNGTDTKGLGRRVKDFLQSRGLQILIAENYKHKPLPRSVILERSGSTFIAEKMADVTGIDREMLFFRRRTLDVSASLLLGDDFNTKKMHITSQ